MNLVEPALDRTVECGSLNLDDVLSLSDTNTSGDSTECLCDYRQVQKTGVVVRCRSDANGESNRGSPDLITAVLVCADYSHELGTAAGRLIREGGMNTPSDARKKIIV